MTATHAVNLSVGQTFCALHSEWFGDTWNDKVVRQGWVEHSLRIYKCCPDCKHQQARTGTPSNQLVRSLSVVCPPFFTSFSKYVPFRSPAVLRFILIFELFRLAHSKRRRLVSCASIDPSAPLVERAFVRRLPKVADSLTAESLL